MSDFGMNGNLNRKNHNFNVGDTIRLKSCGTTTNIYNDEKTCGAFCKWIDSKGNPKQDLFAFENLGNYTVLFPNEGISIDENNIPA